MGYIDLDDIPVNTLINLLHGEDLSEKEKRKLLNVAFAHQSLNDLLKMEHIFEVFNQYSLSEIQQLIPLK
jgi:hypothetical protein